MKWGRMKLDESAGSVNNGWTPTLPLLARPAPTHRGAAHLQGEPWRSTRRSRRSARARTVWCTRRATACRGSLLRSRRSDWRPRTRASQARRFGRSAFSRSSSTQTSSGASAARVAPIPLSCDRTGLGPGSLRGDYAPAGTHSQRPTLTYRDPRLLVRQAARRDPYREEVDPRLRVPRSGP